MKKSKVLPKIILISVLGIIAAIASVKLFTNYLSDDPKAYALQLLEKADIKVNGSRPWDIQVHNEALYARVMQEGSLGLGEAYMDGWWDCPALDQFFYKILSADLDKHIKINWTIIYNALQAQFTNLQTKMRSRKVGEQHYDLGNELYEKMLDAQMIYSCGYWAAAESLDQAQDDKLDLICKKLELKPGMTMLDIGCGWGGLARYAAKHYGAKVTGITISIEQAQYAQAKSAGLPVKIILQDYRDLHEQFDRVVSVGMFEHVGYKNYATFMEVVHNNLKDDGLCLLHTIGGNISNTSSDPWILKYIFPNSMLPSMVQIAQAAEGKFIIEDWHNFGAHYDTTLMSWFERFDKQWHTIKTNYDDRFYRMWKYYLLSCAGLFRARKAQLWQVVLSKKGVPGGYKSVR